MTMQLHFGRRALHALLAFAVLLLAALPAAVRAQEPIPEPLAEPPIGVFFSPTSTGSTGGDHILLTIKEDGTATLAFFNMQDELAAVYTGIWLYDPYGTVTLELDMQDEESCAEEEDVGTMTFLPSTSGDTLTAIHYPKCIWGDGGLTLIQVSDQQVAEIEQAYTDAGLIPGPVFQTEVIEGDDGFERQYTLNLGYAEQAMFITGNMDGEPPAVELGEWTATVYTVTVTLTGTVDTLYDEPEQLAFGFVKDGTRSMAAYEFDAEKYGDQGLLMIYQPQLPALLAQAEEDAEVEIAGIYTSDVLPAADTPGLVQTLALFETGDAQNTYNYLNGEAPAVELGAWQDNEDGSITVVVTGTAEIEAAEPITTTYSVSDQQLQAENIVLHKLPVVEPDSADSETSN